MGGCGATAKPGHVADPAAFTIQVTVDFIVSTHRVWLGAARGRFER
tara:strand:- start:795 stop:932 length:138 start_codon:yes stop_codon:yes gene_type:complete